MLAPMKERVKVPGAEWRVSEWNSLQGNSKCVPCDKLCSVPSLPLEGSDAKLQPSLSVISWLSGLSLQGLNYKGSETKRQAREEEKTSLQRSCPFLLPFSRRLRLNEGKYASSDFICSSGIWLNDTGII